MEPNLSSEILLKHRTQFWQAAVCLIVGAYLALGVATNSVRGYHWFMLAAIPCALLSAERGRKFFVDWAPLFAFWLVYDRLRLIQPQLYSRVAVETPFLMEQRLFGWVATGTVPAHAANAWLSGHSGILAQTLELAAQIAYFSHLFVVPVTLFALWLAGVSREGHRALFRRHIRAFTILNFSAIAIYLLLPVAPPWWVTLNGLAPPTPELVAQVQMTAAMSGSLTQGMIKNASQWFAAVPSLHAAYPVLLLLLALRTRRLRIVIGVAVYACAVWTSTVVLNQHYLIDLLAGAFLAVVAWRATIAFERFKQSSHCSRQLEIVGEESRLSQSVLADAFPSPDLLMSSHTTFTSPSIAPCENRSSENRITSAS
jgi:membrane-associated phospholipid phosphatase